MVRVWVSLKVVLASRRQCVCHSAHRKVEGLWGTGGALCSASCRDDGGKRGNWGSCSGRGRGRVGDVNVATVVEGVMVDVRYVGGGESSVECE